MVKESCTGRNLINHCKQINNPKDLKYEFTVVKNYKGTGLDEKQHRFIYWWVCELSFNKKTFVTIGQTKKKAIDNVCLLANNDLRVFSK